MLTLKTHAHAMRDEETDLGLADFGAVHGLRRPYTAPDLDANPERENAAEGTPRRRGRNLEHETGLEPATTTLATWSSTN